jgi:glycosyltransferase involved in cell wall biosynthesis
LVKSASPAIVHWTTETGWRGGERQVLLLAQGLAARGWTQVIVAPPGTPLAERAAAAGITVMPGARRPLLCPWSLRGPRAWLARCGGGIVHAHTSPALDAAVWLARFAQVTAIVHTRRVAFPLRARAKYRTAAQRYIAISDAIAKQFRAIGTERERITVIPSAIDDSLLAVEPALSPFPGHPLVVCVAQFTSEKGLIDLAHAWPLIRSRQPDARLVLVGDGPERAAVTAALGDDLATVHFTGWSDEVPGWLRAASLYVQPSRYEGLGSTAVEAALCALPIVVTKSGGLPEVVAQGQGGMIAEVANPTSLAVAISELLADPGRGRMLGAAAQAHARSRFGLPSLLNAHEQVYRSLAGCV